MSWKTVKLGEVIKHRKGFITISDEEEYKLCRVQLHRKGILIRSITKGATIKTKKQQVCKANDFIVAEMDAKIGGYGFIPKELDGAIVSSHYYLFEVDESVLKRDFLTVISKNLVLQNQIKSVGSTNYARVSPKDVLAWEIPLPSIEEQERIINSIQIVDSNKEKITAEISHQLDLVSQLRQAFLREGMQGKLVPQNEADEPAEILLEKIKAEKEKLVAEKKIKLGKIQEPEKEQVLFDIPSNWIWCILDDICIYITDGTHQTPTYTPKGRMFLSAQNIKPFRFMPENHKFVSEDAYDDYTRGRKAEKGDLLVARVGAGIGETAVIDKDIDFAFYVSLGLVKPFQDFLNSDYLATVLNSPFGVNYAKGNISSKGGSAGNFNLGRIRSFPVPLPPLAEQKRIIKKLERLMKFCDELETNIRESKTQAENLLQVALKEALEPKEELKLTA